MEARLDGKVVLVTGATQGIGRAIALECAASGAQSIVLSGLDQSDGDLVADEIASLGCHARMVTEDLSKAGAAERLYRQASAAFGRVDALVNSAGLTNRASTRSASRQDWKLLLKVNTEEPFFLIQSFIEDRLKASLPGEVVNILSMNAHCGSAELAVYSASKAALATITRNTAHTHRHDRIKLNGINVGWVDTPGERNMQAHILGKGESWLEQAEAAQPSGRLLKPDEIANLTVFLLSNASGPMTGAIIDQEQWVIGGPQ